MAQVRDLVDATAAGAVDGWASAGEQLADARPAGRFKGVDPEPRPGLRGGHMPGARSVPFPQVRAARAGAGGWALRAAPARLAGLRPLRARAGARARAPAPSASSPAAATCEP